MQHKNPEYYEKIENYIDYFYFKNGIPPTNIEISRGTSLSTATVSRYLNKMSEMGILTVYGHRNIKTKKMQNEKKEFIKIPMAVNMENEDKKKEVVAIESEYWGNGMYFLLEMETDNMKNADIMKGDLLLIKKQDRADNGNVVLVSLNGQNAIFRFFLEKGSIRLHSENEMVSDICCDSCDIKGIVKRVVKKVI